jgi:ectoine hydroxylase-related dioxygenase (phytanoyl-CoA dioxygenase family)
MKDKFANIPTAHDQEFFRENGYWISPVLFSKEELENFKEHYYHVLHGNYETGIPPYKRNLSSDEISKGIVKITNAVWSNSVLSQLILDTTVGRMAARLLGTKTVRFWRDHLWYKPPQSGQSGIVGWHQDYYYWQCAEPPDLITAWIALDDVDQVNGCLEVIPGSHRWDSIVEGGLYSQNLDEIQTKIESITGEPFQTVPCILPAGAVSFHHCLMVHGSRPNRSNRPRISISVHLFAEGVRYRSGRSIKPFSNEQLLSGDDGAFFAGPHFPIVYREGNMSNPWDLLEQNP